MNNLTKIILIQVLFIPIVANAQTSQELPTGTRENYVDYRDNSISDEFNTRILNTKKWGRRNSGGPCIMDHYKDESLVKMESETNKNGSKINFVSIKATAKNGPIRTAGLVSKASAYYGFYVVRFRFRGLNTDDVKEKGTVWHPAVWCGVTDHTQGKTKKCSSNDHWLEIDFMEWENGANGWSSDAPARFVDSKGMKRKVITHGQAAEKAIMDKGPYQTYDEEWQTLGLEYSPEQLKLWQWSNDEWSRIGERVVKFVEDDALNPEKSYTLSTIGNKARKPVFWLLGNIVARYIYSKVENGTNTHTINDMAVDFDFFRYYRHKSAENMDWPWENQLRHGGGEIQKN